MMLLLIRHAIIAVTVTLIIIYLLRDVAMIFRFRHMLYGAFRGATQQATPPCRQHEQRQQGHAPCRHY